MLPRRPGSELPAVFVPDAPPPVIAPAPDPVLATCNGETITAIDIYRYAPSPRGRNAEARAASDPAGRGRRLDADTRVIAAYLRLRVGGTCTEQNRADSERSLRLQRFIASAAVTPLEAGPGRVRIRVDVVNEFELVVGGGLAGLQLDEIRLGTLDYRGKGRTVIGSLERGGAYRSGIGADVVQPGVFGHPATLSFSGAFAPLGGHSSVDYVLPFLAEAQANAVLVHLSSEERYDDIYRNAQETASARVQRSAYQVGVMHRIGRPGRGLIGLAGLLALGAYSEADTGLVFVTDSGLQPVTDGHLDSTYGVFQSHHITALAAVRALRFRRAGRLDALRAEQDIATGIEVSVLGGPRVGGPRNDLLGVSLFLGAGGERSYGVARAHFEGRLDGGISDGDWEFVVAHAEASWYRIRSARQTRTWSLLASSTQGHPLPVQLSMRDHRGGVLGHAYSTRAGASRVVLRREDRWLLTDEGASADVAIGMFADVGQLWAGDAPFGFNTPLMGSVGLSLMGAYPSGGKRTYRLDIGVPIVRGPGDRAVAIRFSAFDRSSTRMPEPNDIRRSRFETGPATALRW